MQFHVLTIHGAIHLESRLPLWVPTAEETVWSLWVESAWGCAKTKHSRPWSLPSPRLRRWQVERTNQAKCPCVSRRWGPVESFQITETMLGFRIDCMENHRRINYCGYPILIAWNVWMLDQCVRYAFATWKLEQILSNPCAWSAI